MAYPSALDLLAANTALARISERAIPSFGDNSPAARQVSLLYPRCRNLMFAAMDWRFATARALLAPATAGVYPWAYQFPLPPGVARCRMVVNSAMAPGGLDGGPVQFEEGTSGTGRVLWCDLAAPVLVYTALIEDPALWDDGFFSAFTVQLAAELAFPITGNGQLAQAMRAEAVQALQAQMPTGQAQSVTPQSRGPSTTTAARTA